MGQLWQSKLLFLWGVFVGGGGGWGIQWNLYNADTIGTTSNCPYYRGVLNSEVSGIFLVGVAMCTHAVERFEGAFHSSPSPYNGKKG